MASEISIYSGGKGIARQWFRPWQPGNKAGPFTLWTGSREGICRKETGQDRSSQKDVDVPELSSAFHLLLLLVAGIRLLTRHVINSP